MVTYWNQVIKQIHAFHFFLALLLLAPTFSAALESQSITSSHQPGELWMRHYEPSPDFRSRSTIRHSMDYGYSWETVYGNDGKRLSYHREQQKLAISNGFNVILTDDNFQSDTTWVSRTLSSTEWLPDTLAWAAFRWGRGFSFDSLQTYEWPSWGGYDGDYQFYVLEQYTSLGWSPGDFITYGRGNENEAVFAFSTDFADTFAVRSVGALETESDYTTFLARGFSPGEMYCVDVSGYHHGFSVSLDTMATWSEWIPLPNTDSDLYAGCLVETERGWHPGEWYFFLFDEWAGGNTPRIGLFHTGDYGSTWTLVYSTVEEVAVADTAPRIEIHPITVHPNPGNGLFEIQSTQNFTDLRLYNSLGRLVMKLPVGQGKNVWSIDLTPYASGSYFLLYKDRANQPSYTKIQLIK